MRFKSRTRAMAVAALAASVSLAGLTTVATPAGAAPAETDRVAGQTRYGTAAEAATRAYPTGSSVVVVTTGEKLPDALSANPIAGENDAPILLVQENAIPAETAAAMAELDPETVIIVGGTAAVSEGVETQIEAMGITVQREAGADRFETAAEVARAVGEAPAIDADGTGSQTAMPTVALANGLTGLADAVAASPMLHQEEIPLLLTGPEGLNEDAMQAIEDLGATQVLILGGTAAVSDAAEDELEGADINVERLAGATRFETAAAIADFEVDFLGFDPATTFIASGFSLADALAGGPLASVENGPIVLVSETDVPAGTEAWVTEHAAEIDEVVAIGGTAVINDGVLTQVAELADEDAEGNDDFTVTPSASEQIVLNPDDPAAGGLQTYTFSGLTPGAEYDVAVMPCSDPWDGAFSSGQPYPNENGDSVAGSFQFMDNDQDDVADSLGYTWNGYAFITQAGGEGISGQYADDIAADESGEMIVTLDSDDADCAVPVLFADADDDDSLDLAADDTPTEEFAVGGATVWHFGEAADFSDPGSAYVIYVDKDANTYVTDDGDLFVYDANDDFAYEDYDNDITFDEFEQALSVGDYIDIGTDAADDYRTNEAAESGFVLQDDYAYAPTNVTTTVGDFDNNAADLANNDVLVEWDELATPGGLVDYYEVYRYNTADDTYTYVGSTDDDESYTDNETSIVDDDVEPGTYYYAVYTYTVSDDGSSNEQFGKDATTVTTVTEQATGAPVSEATTTNDVDSSGTLSAGDVLTVNFDQAMAALGGDETITLTDEDGTAVVIDCAANATCALGAGDDGNDTLTVTITSVSTTSAGTEGGLQFPATVTDSNGVTDLDQGLEWNLATGDVTFE